MKNFKAIAGILLVFFLGAAGGALVTHMIHETRLQRFISGGGHGMREDVIVERLTKKLDLDGRQQEEVRAVIHETHDGVRQVRNSIHPRIEALLTAGQERIKLVLRPDQRVKFDKIITERKLREASKDKRDHE